MKLGALAKVIYALIVKGKTEGLRERIDVLFAAGSITEAEYNYLLEALSK